jgi:CelD/BcsL family acetyltransferase involved in cellulose biosynthesis
MSALAINEVRDVAALEQLAPEWWDLWRRIPSATPFQSPAWLIPWWRIFSPGVLCVITAREAGRLVGLAPFYIEQGVLGRRVLPIGIAVSDYLDVLLDPECANAAAAAVVSHLNSRDIGWYEWELSDLAPDAAAFALPVPFGCTERLQPSVPCPVLALPGDSNLLLHAVSPHKRANLQNAGNRARRRGVLEYVQADSATAPRLFASLIQLHTARWISRGEAGVLSDPRVQQFHREAVRLLFAARLLRLTGLKIAGRIAAVHYGFLHRFRAYSYITGFDPEFSFESPGALLLAHAIEQSIREGAVEFHFLRGKEKYKYDWGATDRWNVRRVFHRHEAYAHAS